MDDPMHQYCVSWFSIQVCTVGTKLAVQAWNHHPRSCMWLRYICGKHTLKFLYNNV